MSDYEKVKNFIELMIKYDKEQKEKYEMNTTAYALYEGGIIAMESILDYMEELEK